MGLGWLRGHVAWAHGENVAQSGFVYLPQLSG